ncbi:hypothetical protein QUC31_019814 [Theobroma cacao]|nr:hypothetical protein QQP08_026376 [Theobroma cacao]
MPEEVVGAVMSLLNSLLSVVTVLLCCLTWNLNMELSIFQEDVQGMKDYQARLLPNFKLACLMIHIGAASSYQKF